MIILIENPSRRYQEARRSCIPTTVTIEDARWQNYGWPRFLDARATRLRPIWTCRNPSTETTDEFGEEDDGPLGLIVLAKVTTTKEEFAEIRLCQAWETPTQNLRSRLCFKLRYDV